MNRLRQINKIDVFFWISVFFLWLVIRMPFFLNPVANIDVSLTVAETVSRLFLNTPPVFSPDEGIVKLLFVLPVLFFTRDFLFLGIPPMVFSFLSVVLTYVVTLNLFDKNSARYSAVLLVFSLWHADYSAYIEMYTFYSCISLVWVLLFINFLRKQTVSSNLYFWICSFIAFYTYIPYVIFVFVFSLWLYLLKNKSKLKLYSKGFIVFIVWFFAYLMKMLGIFSYRHVVGSTIESADFFKALLDLFFVRDNFCLFLLMVAAGVFLQRRQKTARFFMLIFALIFSSFLFFYLSYLLKLAFFPRYLFFVYPLWMVLCASTLGIIHKHKPILAILILCVSLFPVGQKLFKHVSKKQNIIAERTIHSQENFYRSFNDALSQHGQKGDLVMMDSFVMFLGMQHYMDRANNYPVGMMSVMDNMALFFENKHKFIHISDDDLDSYILELKKYYKRIWLVCSENPQRQVAYSAEELKDVFELEGFKVYMFEFSSFSSNGEDILAEIEKHYLHYPFERR